MAKRTLAQRQAKANGRKMHGPLGMLYPVSMRRAKEKLNQRYVRDIQDNLQVWFRIHGAKCFWSISANSRGREVAEAEQKEEKGNL